MKRFSRLFVVLFVLCSLFLIAASPVSLPAQDADPVPVPEFSILGELFGLLGLGVLGTLPAALVSVMKYLPFVKDGDSRGWAALVSMIVLISLYAFNLIAPMSFAEYEPLILKVSEDVIALIGMFAQFASIFAGSGFMYAKILKGVPVVGHSFSD